jgi:hypothetical protein
LLALVHEVMLLDDEAVPAIVAAAAEVNQAQLDLARRAALEACAGEETIGDVLRRADDALLDSAETGADPAPGTADAIATATFGDLSSLLRFVGDEALELRPARQPVAPIVQATVRDVLLSVWASNRIEPELVQVLAYAWRTARTRAPRWSADRRETLGPQVGEITLTCAQLRRMSPGQLERLLEAHSQVAGWPELMHSAAWAAYLSGRLRAVTVAQLAGGAAVLHSAGRAGWPAARVRSLLAPVCGAVTAEVLADLLDDVTYWGLTGAYTSVRVAAA